MREIETIQKLLIIFPKPFFFQNIIPIWTLLQKYYRHTLIGHLVFSLQNPVYKRTSTSDNIVFLRNCNSYSQFVIFLLFIFTEFGLCRAIDGRAYRGISYQKLIGKFAGNDSIIFKDLYYKSLKSNKIWPAHSFLI